MTQRIRSFSAPWLAVIVGCLTLTLSEAKAESDATGVEKQIKAKNAQAMENFDLLEFDEAKRLLTEALGLAKKANLRSPLVARTHLNLGIVYFSGFQDEAAAKTAFIDAVQMDASIEIEKVYRTPEMTRILAETKKEYAGKPPRASDPAAAGGGDCTGVEGMQHSLVEQAPAGRAQKITVSVSDKLKADKISLYYRSKGQVEFAQLAMKRSGECKYSGTLPAKALRGGAVHYYVAALNKKGKPIASRGSSESPNIIEVTGAAKGALLGDNENPLTGEKAAAAEPVVEAQPAEEVSGSVLPQEDKGDTLYVSLALGSGGGYVTGQTEQAQSDVGCCFAPALLHVFPEVGYYLKPNMVLAAAFRMGFPVGANLPGHATAAPAGFLRFKYALDSSGEGINVSGSVGGGILRHTVKLNMPAMNGDTDTVASGPFLVGAGAGYTKALGGPMKFVAEVNTLAGIPGPIETLGTCPGPGCVRPNFALQIDVNLGVLFAF